MNAAAKQHRPTPDTEAMNSPAITILLLPAVCCMATAQQPASIEQFCAEAATFADTLTKALEMLQKIENKELDSHYKTFCDWLEVTPENRIRKFWVLDGDIASEFTDATPFFEGSVRVREHKQRERNRKVVEQAKRLFKQKNGRLYCQICGLDFEQVYGEIGKGFIEAHHNVPLAAEDKEREIRVCDFTLVCSNCHSMLHRVFGGESPTIEDLKKRMKNKE